jgi:uncharacterized protein (TIGR02611 family)
MLHVTLKYVRIFVGLAVLLVGIVLALPFVPGPGILLIIVGLVILSDHFVWAKRTLHWVKHRWQHVHWKHEWSRSCFGLIRKDSSR